MHNKGNKLPAWLQAGALNSDNLTLLVDTASAKLDITKVTVFWQKRCSLHGYYLTERHSDFFAYNS